MLDNWHELCQGGGYKMPFRYDSSPLKPPKKSSQGFLCADAYLTRAGIFTYTRADGTKIRELRHPDEVFKADSLSSLGLVPLTNDHPKEPVTAENAKHLSVGTVGIPRQDGDMVRAQVVVQDAPTIALMRAQNKHEISCGYTCDVVDEPGVWQGQAYDAVQKNIDYNHVAIVPRGRAGNTHLRMDAAETVYTDAACEPLESLKNMQKIRIDGVDFEVSEQAAQAFAKSQAEKTAEAEKAVARADAAQAELVKVQSALATATNPATIAKAVQERVALEKVAAKVLASDFAALSDGDIKRQVITKKSPDVKLDGKSDDYVQARFDYVCEQLDREQTQENLAPMAVAGQVAQHQDGISKLDAALAAYRSNTLNAWKEAK